MLKKSNDQRKLLPNFEHLFATTAQAPGGVARLRELILTLAVQGKLVLQDPSDEPAGELLKKIRAEKDRLIAEGKIKKDKPLAAITEEEKPFELPVGWEWARVGSAGVTQTGGTPSTSKSENFDGDFPFIGPGQISTQGNILPAEKYISQVGCLDSAVAEPNDIVMVCIGGSIGKCAEVLKTTAFNQQINSIRPILLLSKFVLYSMKSLYFVNSVKAAATGSATPIISKGKWDLILLPIPPLAEQSRIVTRIEALMRLCDALEEKGRLEHTQHQQLLQAMLDSLTQTTDAAELARHWQRLAQHFNLLIDRPEAVDALEQTILQLAVRGLLVPQDANDEPASELLKKIRVEKDRLIAEGKIKKDKPLAAIGEDEKPFELPKGWEWVRFDQLINQQKPISYGVLVPGPDVNSGVPFVRIADLSIDNPPERPEKCISSEVDEQYLRTRLEGGEILMGVVGSIGKLGVAPKTWAGANIARAICRIVPANAGLNDFVLFLLQTKFMQDSFAGDTRTLAQPTLNIGLIRAAITPLPPEKEQSRIVARVTELRALCQQLRDKLTQARTTQTQLAQAWVEQAAA